MIRLLAMDLDGTLVPHSLSISERNKRAVQAAKDAGVLVTVATGRMYASARPYGLELGLEVPIITYNGALVTDLKNEKILREAPVSKDLIRDMMELCREKNWYIQAYHEDRLLVHSENEKSKMYSRIAGVPAYAIGDDLWKVESAMKLLSIATDAEEQAEMSEAYKKYFGDRGNIAESLGHYVEITSLDADKSKAIAFLCDQYNISPKEVMTMGDGGNDVAMLKFAGLGIAMGNAKEEIKEIADAVTGLTDDDGVAEAIETYILKDNK